jgi:hypothetical protein
MEEVVIKSRLTLISYENFMGKKYLVGLKKIYISEI